VQLSLQQLSDRLQRVAAEATREIPAATGRKLVQVGVGGVKKSFATSTAPDGTPWAPLKFPRPSGGSKPLLDSGLLQASVHGTFEGDTLTLRANGPGAALHNFGGTVRPVNAKALAIPITREAAKVTGPRAFPRKLFVVKGKANRGGALAERTGEGKRSRLVIHYLLRMSVQIPARQFMGFSDDTLAAMGEIVEADVGGALLKPLTGPV
jgi:phage gpG-like protein